MDNHSISTTTKYGGSAQDERDGFKLNASVIGLTIEKLKEFAAIGLASVLYRGGASVINDALGVKSNSKSEFSDADAATIVDAVTDWAKGEDSPITGGFDIDLNVDRYVHGEGAIPKYAEEKKIVKRHINDKDIVTWAVDKVGYNGGGELDTENIEFLKAVKAYKQQLLANS